MTYYTEDGTFENREQLDCYLARRGVNNPMEKRGTIDGCVTDEQELYVSDNRTGTIYIIPMAGLLTRFMEETDLSHGLDYSGKRALLFFERRGRRRGNLVAVMPVVRR